MSQYPTCGSQTQNSPVQTCIYTIATEAPPEHIDYRATVCPQEVPPHQPVLR